MTYQDDYKSAFVGLLCLFKAAFIGSVVAFVAFAIIFLIKDYSVCGDASPLWIFVLVSFCVPFFLNYVRIHNQSLNSRDADHVTPLAAGLFMIFEVVIGGILIYGNNIVCESMKRSGLWVIALIIFWFLFSVLTIVMVAFIFLFLVGLNVNPGTSEVNNLEDVSIKI